MNSPLSRTGKSVSERGSSMTAPAYTIVASDGQHYGPNDRDTIQSWINEGRIARDTQMSRNDVEGWFRAGDYQEFSWPPGAPVTAAPVPPVAAETSPVRPEFKAAGRAAAPSLDHLDPGAVAAMRAHGSWFFWIAGIELFYGLMALFQGGGISDAGLIRLVIFGPALLGLGFVARQAVPWAFVLGGILVALRLYEAATMQIWFAVAIRAWALFEVFKGFRLAQMLRRQLRGD